MKLDADRKARLLFAVVLVAGGLALLGWYALSSSEYTTYQIVTRDPVSGLVPDAPIEFHGVDVGKVKRVELVDPRSVKILLSIRNDAPVSAATVATITSRGLATRGFTGYVYISLEDVGDDRRPIAVAQGYPAIRTAPSRMVNLDLAIDQVNRNVELVTQRLDSALDPATVASLKQSAASLERVSRMLETQVLPQTQKTLAHVDTFSVSMGAFADRLNRDPGILVRGIFHHPQEAEAQK